MVSNVEQYSHARLWFSIEHKSSALSTFEPPPPPPPPPAVLYSAAVPPPDQLERALAALPAEGEGLADVALVPQLACALHPWVSPRLRESAALRLARLLMLAWKRGTHDETLLYLLESSLAARRLARAQPRGAHFSASSLRPLGDVSAIGSPMRCTASAPSPPRLSAPLRRPTAVHRRCESLLDHYRGCGFGCGCSCEVALAFLHG